MSTHFTSNKALLIPGKYFSAFKRSYLICLIFFLYLINAFSQVNVEVSKPKLTLINDSLIIEYTITGQSSNDEFKVWLEISDTTGTIFSPKNISGDIGDNISGGSPKKIIWNLSADSVFINMNLSVEVFITKSTHSKPVMAEKKIEIPSEIIVEQKDTLIMPVEVGLNMLRSAIIPGWGLTRLSGGKPYWLLVIIEYGCIITSVSLNAQASSNYDKYVASKETEEQNTFFDKGKEQYAASNLLAYSAIGFWIADLGITWIKASKMKRNALQQHSGSFLIKSSYNYTADAPILSFVYIF